MRIALGVFIIFHALVHLMYVGQALRWFELKPGMDWPDEARFLPSGISDHDIRTFAALAIGTTALAMIVGVAGFLARAGWGNWTIIAGAALVSLAHVLLWSGRWAEFADDGGIGVIINVAVIAAVLVLR